MKQIISTMSLPRLLRWISGSLLALIALVAVLIAIFGWNWLRGPIERMTLEHTGRVLVIHGDMGVSVGWPAPHLHAGAVSFANPAWAKEAQMLAAEAVDVSIDLPQLLARNIVLPEVRLTRPVIYLEQGSEGRKNWLLDKQQQDEDARIRINRLMLDNGSLGYDDSAAKTSLRAELSTSSDRPTGEELSFTAQGKYRGMPLKLKGNGGPVLGLRDEKTPYPLKAELSIGRTSINAEGSITSLIKFTALDMHLKAHGDSLALLFPLLGIAFPETSTYATEGHLVHTGRTWRYEKFSGHIGNSDMAGSVEVETGGKRPVLKATLTSNRLDIDDLGPLIGSRPGSVAAATSPDSSAHVLPDLPFKTTRWNSVDADVSLTAKTLRHAKALPLEDLVVHLKLNDSVLTLDPINFGVADGNVSAVITLDGGKTPIEAHAQVRARKLMIAKLMPTIDRNKTSIGQLNGEFDLKGRGDTVGQMLASSNGKLGLVVVGGGVSKLMMEKAGLHLWEILALKASGDKLIKLRCGVADFDVKDGLMQVDALVFDTEVTTILGTGNIDLGQERLDLTLNQKTKNTSPLAFRSPIYLRGSFAKPEVSVDKGRIAMRAIGALALGAVNPLLAIIPLIDAGPGEDSDCRQLVRDARALPHQPRRPKNKK